MFVAYDWNIGKFKRTFLATTCSKLKAFVLIVPFALHSLLPLQF